MYAMFKAAFWWLDLAIAIGVTTYVLVGCRSGERGRFITRLFWLGVAIGLAWEVPIFISARFAQNPVIELFSQPPVPTLTLILFHSLWDGGLFLAGVALIWLVVGRPVLQGFSWVELGVLILWGQLSELAVEIGGVTNDAWGYVGGFWWNPVLFHVDGHPITLMPQLIWLAAPIVYYIVALQVVRPAETPKSQTL